MQPFPSRRPALPGWLLVLSPLLLLPLLTPFWAVNDDVLMILTAKGLGLVDRPDPNLLYTHSAFGAVLSSLYRVQPDIPWYPSILLLITALSLAAVGRDLFIVSSSPERRILACVFAFGFTLNFFGRPTYSIPALLASLAGWTLWFNRIDDPRKGAEMSRVFAVVSLWLLAFLIRPLAFGLGTLLSIPLLLGRLPALRVAGFRRMRPWFWGVAAATILIIALGVLTRPPDPEREEWRRLREFQTLSAILLDYQRVGYDATTAPIFRGVGWTPNDLALFAGWYFLDEERFSNERLRALTRRLWGPSLRDPLGKWASQWKQALGTFGWIALVWAVLLGFLQTRERRLGYAALGIWILGVLTAMAVFLKLPRFLAEPALAFLVWTGIRGFKPPSLHTILPRKAVLGVLLIAAMTAWGFLFAGLHREQADLRVQEAQIRRSLTDLKPQPDDLFVFWDSIFPYERIRAFDSLELLRPFRLVCLTLHQRTPLARRRLDPVGIRDLSRALYDDPRIRILANRFQVESYRRMAWEKWGIRVDAEVQYEGPIFNVYRFRRTP